MRVTPILAALSAVTLMVGCDQNSPMSTVDPPAPSMSISGGKSWTLTTYFWDNGWVRQTALNAAYLPADLRIGFNAHNWDPYPAFWAEFDNIRAFGDIDLPQGVIEDFDNGLIGTIWDQGGDDCVWGLDAQACVDAGRGVLVAEVQPGSASGEWNIVGLNTDPVVHGEFDVQLDFTLDPAFHTLDEGTANVMLCLWDEFYVSSICIEIDSGFYDTWRGVDGTADPYPQGFIVGRTFTDHLEGKLRITRTRTQKGRVEESVAGSGAYTTEGEDGYWRTFSFSARRYADGTVDGQWQRITREDGNATDSKSHGNVTCLSIVGDQAWIGGYATSGVNSIPPNRVAWRVVDNGQGSSASPDQISAQYWLGGGSLPAWYCATMPEAPDLHEIEAGNILIKR